MHTASLKSGDADRRRRAVQVLDEQGRDASSTATTDDDGNALIAYALEGRARAGRQQRQATSRCCRSTSRRWTCPISTVAGRKQAWFDVFAWSGRDLYRPGETIRLSALLRDYDGKPIKPQPLFVDAEAARWPRVSRRRSSIRRTSATSSGRATIPADAPTGRWQVEFRTDPDSKEATQGLTLPHRGVPARAPEARPRSAPQTVLKPGEAAQARRATADYLYGAPAAGNRFTARLTAGRRPASGRCAQGLLLRRSDHRPAEGSQGRRSTTSSTSTASSSEDIELADDGQARPRRSRAIAVRQRLRNRRAHGHAHAQAHACGRPTRWSACVRCSISRTAPTPNARAGFEVIRSNANGDLLAGQPLKVTLVREHRDYRWTFDNESGWHFDYSAALRERRSARTRRRRRQGRDVRRAGRMGQLPHRDPRSGDRPDDALAVLRRLELERREPRQAKRARTRSSSRSTSRATAPATR